MLDYREEFFYEIVKQKLGYTPSIRIKPVHLANGFFRAIVGGYLNNEAQHLAAYPKDYPYITETTAPPRVKNLLAKLTPKQNEALAFLEKNNDVRAMLASLLGADGTVYKSVRYSSYTLSHFQHITNDNHDREAGEWLHHILKNIESKDALTLLEQLLKQAPLECTDELSVLTLPLAVDNPELKQKQEAYQLPESLRQDPDGRFKETAITSIANAFECLARNERGEAQRMAKFDTLERIVTLACFSLYLHLANAGNSKQASASLVPMLFRLNKDGQTLKQASIGTYQWVHRSIDRFLRDEIIKKLETLRDSEKYGRWDINDIEFHIKTTIDWYRTKADKSKPTKQEEVKRLRRDCSRFYQSYRGESAQYSPIEALGHALADMLGRVLSSTPTDIARYLGNDIGLLARYAKTKEKSYEPEPDLLEVLVRSSIPRGEVWSLHQLAEHWAANFGILVGVLGDENERLQNWGVQTVDRGELLANTNALAELLESSGYARRYADGVVLVSVY